MLFTNYVTSAWRHILRHRLYSIINIVGLAVGMAACLLIFLFVRYESSYDSWLPNADNIYRVNYTNFYKNGDHYISAKIPGITKAIFDQRFPQIEASTRFYNFKAILTFRDDTYKESVWVADSNIFDVINLKFIEGDKKTAFDDLSTIVLSEKMALKYFGNKSPLGEVFSHTLILPNAENEMVELPRDYKVTGVFEDIPENSEFNFDFIFPLDKNFFQYTGPIYTRWNQTWGYLYLKLIDGANPEIISSQLEDLVEKNAPTEDERTANETYKLSLLNLTDIHLHSEGRIGGIKPIGSITQVYTFSIVAALILLIGCINFMNLSTARSLQRAKEISMRKVLGANRAQLIRQFLGESLFMATIGLLLAITIVEIILPSFNAMTGLPIDKAFLQDPLIILVVVGLLFFIGIVAGLYPSFYLTAFQPSDVLSSVSAGGHQKGLNFRNTLTIFQFSVSIALIISTAVVYSQNIYSLTRDLGYSKENKLILRGMGDGDLAGKRETVANEVERLEGVRAVSLSTAVPADMTNWHNSFTVIDEADAEQKAIAGFAIDEKYFDIYDIPMLYGRNFSLEHQNDKVIQVDRGEEAPIAAAILNEMAARQLGFTNSQDAIGRLIQGDVKYKIIGIVSDFHFHSMRQPLHSFFYMYNPERFNTLTIDYWSGTDISQLRREVDEIWNSFVPDYTSSYDFIEDRVASLYIAETKQAQMLLAFSLLAVIVACLGLYGLAAFTAEQRTKEIAVRKVHGAGVYDIVKLLLLQFSKPVLISNVIAWPAAWYFMTDYLNGFTFRIDLSIIYFSGTGLIALLIAWATTTRHAVKAARTNPAVVLKGE